MWSIARVRAAGWIVALSGAALAAGAAPLSGQAEARVIRGLKFQGNKAIPGEDLALSISTTNSQWLVRMPLIRELGLGEKRYFNPTAFGNDLYAIELLYKASGYPDVKVDSIIKRSDDGVRITIKITEGAPIIIDGLTIDGGDLVHSRFRVVRELPIARGDVYNRLLLRDADDTMTARLRERGYPSARVEWKGTVDSAAKTVRVAFQLIPGPPAVFGMVTVSGFQKIDSAFVASLLTVEEGRPYRHEELYRSQLALNSSQLFRTSSVEIDSAVFVRTDSTVVPVRVRVEEGRMHAAQANLGFGTKDCFRAGAGWTARNFVGRGLRLDLKGDLWKIGVGDPLNFGACPSLLLNDSIGSARANFSLQGSLQRNGFLSPDNTLTFSVFGQRRSEFQVYLREEVGFVASITRETYARIPVTLAYRLTYGQTTASSATFCGYFNSCTNTDIEQLRQPGWLGLLSLSATRLRVNNPLDPTRGTSLSAEVAAASRLLGSTRNQQFVRMVGDAAGYLPLSRQFVLAGRFHGGLIFAPQVGLSGGKDNFIPPDQRLFAGGSNDVRGYDRNELGPVVYVIPKDDVREDGTFDNADTRVSPTGGDRVVTANLELRAPSPVLPKFLRFVAFVDAGALWGRNTNTSLRVTPGVGIRIVSGRIPPVRFDIGYNKYLLQEGPLYATSDKGELELIADRFVKPRPSRWTLHFSIGQAF